jgi:hypothetical protein
MAIAEIFRRHPSENHFKGELAGDEFTARDGIRSAVGAVRCSALGTEEVGDHLAIVAALEELSIDADIGPIIGQGCSYRDVGQKSV